MDYEYYDESRTRFQLQSGPSVIPADEKKKVAFLEVGSCFSLALLLLGFSWFSEGFLQFLLLWIASALFAGPFAPPSATGGACRVGIGELLPAEQEQEVVETESFSIRNSKQRRKSPISQIEEPLPLKTQRDENSKEGKKQKGGNGELADDGDDSEDDNGDGDDDGDADDVDDDEDDVYDYDGDVRRKTDVCDGSHTQLPQGSVNTAKNEADWTSTDVDLLKKLMVRYPRGMLKRWEVIAEAFDGAHSVESIVKMSKATGERKKGSNDDSYSDFLAKRKGSANTIASPLSQRWDSKEALVEDDSSEKSVADEDGLSKMAITTPQGEEKKKSEWTETEDKALLNALKTFPKDSPMRWEKVAHAVPSRTKQQCFRRFAQLKESFRNNKVEKV